MRHKKIISSLTTAIATATTLSSAHGATAPHLYANAFSAHNIAAMQHSISLAAIGAFEGSAAAAMGSRDTFAQQRPAPSTRDTYGRAPEYGTMPTYGEYGDDGTVFQGRSGGDTTATPIINSTWLQWRHFGDDVRFRSHDIIDSDYDLIMAGLNGGHAKFGNGISQWGLYGGYAGSTMENNSLAMTGHGGYMGVYGGYNTGNFNMALTATGGAIHTDAKNIFGTDQYANMWAGAALNATYNIALDDTFTLQPGLFASYTWAESADYIAASGQNINNRDFSFWELAPGIRAIKHIAQGWFGFATFKYVFGRTDGGTTTIDELNVTDLSLRDYSEYGLGIEKSINKFNVAINLTRRDGGRNGWGGGVNLKYIF